MEITWYGHSCFRLKGSEATVVTDPVGPEAGYAPERLSADIVTISHGHPGHSNVAAISGVRKTLRGPGEYEVANVLVVGVATFHDADHGAKLGRNTAFVIEIDGVRVCHLGDLGHVPHGEQMAELINVDILLVPVGGSSTIGPTAAAEVVNLIEPKLVVPMHYRTPACSRPELEGPERFLKEMGLTTAQPQARLAITRQGLTKEKEAQVVVLEYQH